MACLRSEHISCHEVLRICPKLTRSIEARRGCVVDDRWVEVTPSQFAHEADGLRIVRDLLPKRAPFRAWTNFEFRDDRGNSN